MKTKQTKHRAKQIKNYQIKKAHISYTITTAFHKQNQNIVATY